MYSTHRQRIAMLLLCLVAGTAVFGQSKSSTFESNGYTFPKITMERMLHLCDIDSVAFDSVMRSQGFASEENIYTKGAIDKSKMVFAKSEQFGTSLVWISNDTTASVVERMLEKFAHPDNVSLADGFSFMYKKYVITVKSTKGGLNYEEVNVIDKVKYKHNQEN